MYDGRVTDVLKGRGGCFLKGERQWWLLTTARQEGTGGRGTIGEVVNEDGGGDQG